MAVRGAVGLLAGLCLVSGPWLVAGCGALAGDGDLDVPKDIAVCSPAVPDGVVLVGMALTNAGDEDVTLTSIVAAGLENVADVSILVDREGAELDQMVGALSDPAPDAEDQARIDAIIARLVEPAGVTIAPGATADVIVTIEPLTAGADASVESFDVSYEQGGWSHAADATYAMTLAADGRC